MDGRDQILIGLLLRIDINTSGGVIGHTEYLLQFTCHLAKDVVKAYCMVTEECWVYLI